MRKLKSKVEICKLLSTTPVFLLRYREACKLPPSPRWSPSQGPSSQSGNSVDSLGPSPCASGSLMYLLASLSWMLSAVFTIKLPAETPRALFPPYMVAATPQTQLVWSRKTTSPSDVQQRCAQAPSDKRCVNLTKH